MSGRVGSVFQHALIFGTAPVLQKLVSLLLLPYFTHHLDTDEYGLRDLLVAITGLFPVLFTLEYRVGFLRGFVQAKDENEERGLFTASVLLMTAMALAASVAFVVGWPLILSIFPAAEISGTFRAVLVAGVLLEIVNLMLIAGVQAKLWSKRMVGLNLAQFTVGVVLNIWFVVGMDMGPMGLFLGSTCASLFNLFALLWVTSSLFTSRPSWRRTWETCRPGLAYSFPLWSGALAYFTLRNVDRAVLADMEGLAALGIYGMAWKLSNLLLTFVLVPFQRSFDVWRFKLYEEGRDPHEMADVFRVLTVGVGLLALALATAGIDLFTWAADERYASVGVYLPWLNLAFLCQCGYTVTSSAFFVTGRTGPWVRLFIAAAALQIVACYGLVRVYGPAGAPAALIATNLALYIGASVLGRRLWAVPYRHGLAAGVAVVSTGLAWLHTSVTPGHWLAWAGLDLGLLAAFAIAALSFGWVTTDELTRLGRRVRVRLTRRGDDA